MREGGNRNKREEVVGMKGGQGKRILLFNKRWDQKYIIYPTKVEVKMI